MHRLVLHDAPGGRLMLLTLWESKVVLRDGEMGGALREELGVLALATSSLDTPLTLPRTAWRVVDSDLAASGASLGEHPSAPHPALVAGLRGPMGGPVHRFAPGA